MGWAARTRHRGPGMRNTRTGRAPRLWKHKDLIAALNQEFRIGVKSDARIKGALLHLPSGHGKGKWQSIATLYAYIGQRKVRREIAAASRQVNRAA